MTEWCEKCGSEMLPCSGNFSVTDKYAGSIVIENGSWSECIMCGESARIYSFEVANQIASVRSERIDTMLQSRPLREFVGAVTASAILGISKQAFSKNKRINRGFIFQTKFEEKTVFLRRSVEQFGISGDGRFPLGKFPIVDRNPASGWETVTYLDGVDFAPPVISIWRESKSKLDTSDQKPKPELGVQESAYNSA